MFHWRQLGLLPALVTGGCIFAEAGNTASATQESAIQTLRKLQASLQAKNYDQALSLFKIDSDERREKYRKILAGGESRLARLSEKGIDRLAAKATWEKVKDLPVHTRERILQGSGVSAEECYALTVSGTPLAAFHWDGKQLRIIT
jgi:hypothetical protein